jgi:hypothetical protein
MGSYTDHAQYDFKEIICDSVPADFNACASLTKLLSTKLPMLVECPRHEALGPRFYASPLFSFGGLTTESVEL